jgi:hypothetical protein
MFLSDAGSGVRIILEILKYKSDPIHLNTFSNSYHGYGKNHSPGPW